MTADNMTDGNPTTAVLLINLGGPDSLDSVEPFLYNLFSDPDIMGYNKIFSPLFIKPLAKFIARKRTPLVKSYYSMIGGKSPIVGLTMRQGKALEEALSSYGNIWVFVSMRYCHPTIEEAVEDMLTFPLEKIIVLPLYPHYSVTTTGSSINEFNRVMRQLGAGNVETHIIKEWYDNPTYIDAMCDTIQKTIESHKLNIRKTHIVFSAHGIPLRFIRRGDPYAKQIEKCAVLVAGKLGAAENYHLSYQSRVGLLKWLGPSTEEVLKGLGEKGAKDVVLVPVSFVSDHVETLYEMDILYREKAKGYGISNFYRVPALNDSPLLIDALKDIVLQAYIGNPEKKILNPKH